MTCHAVEGMEDGGGIPAMLGEDTTGGAGSARWIEEELEGLLTVGIHSAGEGKQGKQYCQILK